MHNIHTQVMKKITSGLVQQKPLWKYRLEKILSWGIIALVGLLCVYVMSFVLLVSDEMAFFDMLGFGPRGVFMFIHSMPVFLLVGIILLLIAMVLLVRVYSHAYRFSVLAVLGIIFVVSSVVTFGVRQFDSTMRISHFGERGELPFLKSLHEHYRPPHVRPVAHGKVVSVQDTGFVLIDRHDEILAIITDDNTEYSFNDAIQQGDILRVLGVREGGMITASVVIKE